MSFDMISYIVTILIAVVISVGIIAYYLTPKEPEVRPYIESEITVEVLPPITQPKKNELEIDEDLYQSTIIQKD